MYQDIMAMNNSVSSHVKIAKSNQCGGISRNVGGDECGFCGYAFKEQEQNDKTLYRLRCVLCKVQFNLKKICAKKILTQEGKLSKKDPFNDSTEEFYKYNPNLYCISCKQIECFYCRKIHSSGSLRKICSICEKKWCFIFNNTGLHKQEGFCDTCKEGINVDTNDGNGNSNNNNNGNSKINDGNNNNGGNNNDGCNNDNNDDGCNNNNNNGNNNSNSNDSNNDGSSNDSRNNDENGNDSQEGDDDESKEEEDESEDDESKDDESEDDESEDDESEDDESKDDENDDEEEEVVVEVEGQVEGQVEVQIDNNKDKENLLLQRRTQTSRITKRNPDRGDGYINLGLRDHHVAKPNSHFTRFYDASNKKLFTYERELNRKQQKTNIDLQVLYPEQTWQQLKDLFMSNYTSENEDNRKREEKSNLIQNLMNEHDTYFIMEKEIGSDHFSISTAILIEERIFLRQTKQHSWKRYAIIHLFGTLDGGLKMNSMDKLFETLLHARKLTHKGIKGIYVLTKVGDFKWNPQTDNNENNDNNSMIDLEEWLEDLHFVVTNNQTEIYDHALTDNLVPVCSRIFFGHGADAYEKMKEDKLNNEGCRFFRIQNYTKYGARYYENKFQIYNHVNGWVDCTEATDRYVAGDVKRGCKAKPGMVFKCSALGAREASDPNNLTKEDKKCALKKIFRQSYYTRKYMTDNNCAWLCIAALIDTFDGNAATRMIDRLTKCPQNYDWMFLTKVTNLMKKTRVKYNECNIVSERLKDGIGYMLNKVHGHQFKPDGYMSYILDDSTAGRYVCALQTECSQVTHCVAVDCDNGLIFDCMEKHVLALNKKNLDHCVGADQMSVKSIPLCYRIIAQMKSSKRKRKRDTI